MTKKNPEHLRKPYVYTTKPGKPQEYKEEYCQKLIDHMAKGLSYESFAATIDTSRTTLYNWEKQHPKFLDAKNAGRDKSLLFWEQKAMKGLYPDVVEGSKGPITLPFNTSLWIFNMKNKHGWRDKQPDEDEKVIGFKFVDKIEDDEKEAE